MKYKHASQISMSADFFINFYCIVTRTLNINLELNNFLNCTLSCKKTHSQM